MPTSQKQNAFKHLDRDDDGAISRADFDVVARAVGAEFDLQQTSPKVTALKQCYGEVWEILSGELDIDQDGRISREEFDRAISRLAGEDRFTSHVSKVSGAEFDAADSDDDGSLDREEFTRLMRALSHSGSDVAAMFDRLDADGDGAVSRAEYVSAATGYLSGAGSAGREVFAGI